MDVTEINANAHVAKSLVVYAEQSRCRKTARRWNLFFSTYRDLLRQRCRQDKLAFFELPPRSGLTNWLYLRGVLRHEVRQPNI